MQPPNMKVQQEAEIKCFNKHIAQNNEQDMNYSQSLKDQSRFLLPVDANGETLEPEGFFFSRILIIHAIQTGPKKRNFQFVS